MKPGSHVSEPVTAGSPAKINLVLEVLGRREDGYHEVDTIFQTLALGGSVTLEFGSDQPGVFAGGPCSRGVPADESNLAWRAAEELALRAGRQVAGLRIELEKAVPASAGLGSGASDAATTLRLLQREWPNVTDEMVIEAANAVGSDEACFAYGGTVRGTGRGDRVLPLGALGRHGVVLFVPHISLERKTARMFAELSKLPFDNGGIAARWAKDPPHRLGGEDIYNSFERVAFDVFPALAGLWEQLEARLGEPVRMAGAGPTLFWIGHERAARTVAAAVEGLPCDVFPTYTAGSLWRP